VIYALGDSHCIYTFAWIPGVQHVHLGAITMRRVARADDDIVTAAVRGLNLSARDVLILTFGEIDVRCHVKRWVSEDGGYGALFRLVDYYTHFVSGLNTNGARKAIMSIIPPSPHARVNTEAWPVDSTDAERVEYTLRMNALLRPGCAVRGLTYLDVYTAHADAHGMLVADPQNTDMHLRENHRVHGLLTEAGLL
jgi:hypothetical protein